MQLDFFRLGFITQITPAFCLINQFVYYGIWYGAMFSLAWLSIERHILIFHSIRVATARGRLLFHYIPLILFSLYAPIFYVYLIFFYPCERIYDGTMIQCGDACFTGSISNSFKQYILIAHDFMPIVIIIVSSAALLLRVIIQKRRLRQVNEWRKFRKMITQFILISGTFVIFYLPYTVIYFVKALGFSSFGNNVITYFVPLTNVPFMALPYATIITLPGLRKKLCALIICKPKQNTIRPVVIKN
ncbi:unnamed protein product [Adineta steineri]|uniref:G-protein coupled receptors family 1 profile domain-containing protein n=1 Tax=Adineta steineri TaxID=433720 RepID=A0A813ZRP5_9BILA|nr:unnamed protein product [Adineta steineri]CAF0902550.1 unnamed protein product [Adineta steineri]CAF0928264.1 unnamed protein product [Adineta steineri]